jgi:predicted nucleic acid-binding protein
MFAANLAGLTALTPDPAPPHPAICRDPAGDYLIALAGSASVDAIVTGDLDLLSIAGLEPAVITARQLVERLQADA